MLPLLYVGIISFVSSFSISNFFTREILRHIYEKQIELSNNSFILDNYLIPNIYSKVKFNYKIRVIYIPTRQNISSNSLNKLWYTKNDYDKFKKNFLESSL